MDKFLLIFLGSGIGGYSRFLLATWVTNKWGPAFPLGTLAVNIVGCFIIGLIAGLPSAAGSLSPSTRLWLMTGFLGGLTTFSTYEYESFMLVADGEIVRALLNLVLSVVLCFLAVLAGYLITRFSIQAIKGGI